MLESYYTQIDDFLENQYTRLLTAEIGLLLIPTLIPEPWSGLVATFLETLVIVIIIQILKAQKTRLYTYLLVSLVVLVLEIVNSFSSSVDRIPGILIVVLAAVTHIAFTIMAVFVILKKIFHQKRMTADSIRGGVAVYLLLGFCWYFGYRMLYGLNPSSFNFGEVLHDGRDLVYFSFVTLTTVGYGDITPHTSLAMALAVLEAVMGQMYPAVIISCLISQYITSATESR